jgi:hypothetical protein
MSELDLLAFGPAEPLEQINDSMHEESLRFARSTHQGTGLTYVRDFFGGSIWFTSNPDDSVGRALSNADMLENGALSVSHELPAPLADYDFFFSRRPRAGGDLVATRLIGAVLGDDGTLSQEQELPAPFNSQEVLASYGLALSPKRAVWMRNVDGALGLQLVTSALPPNGEPSDLRLPLPNDCGSAWEFDFAPWLSVDGRALFFAARRVDEGCEPADDAITHLYVLELSSAGQPVGVARALTGLVAPHVRQSDPSLSTDGCELLFSAEDSGTLHLYRAPRIQ